MGKILGFRVGEKMSTKKTLNLIFCSPDNLGLFTGIRNDSSHLNQSAQQKADSVPHICGPQNHLIIQRKTTFRKLSGYPSGMNPNWLLQNMVTCGVFWILDLSINGVVCLC